jgi:hypothetical protein
MSSKQPDQAARRSSAGGAIQGGASRLTNAPEDVAFSETAALLLAFQADSNLVHRKRSKACLTLASASPQEQSDDGYDSLEYGRAIIEALIPAFNDDAKQTTNGERPKGEKAKAEFVEPRRWPEQSSRKVQSQTDRQRAIHGSDIRSGSRAGERLSVHLEQVGSKKIRSAPQQQQYDEPDIDACNHFRLVH